jgi:uracil-DNA glycosylase family 4
VTPILPGSECDLCPRLVEFRHKNRDKFPDFHNAPVDSFGSLNSALLIVGLAPGLKGANRTSRPFTGDYAGDLLYPTISTFGFASGAYGAKPDDGLKLKNCRITNAVRCVPPENKPVGIEMNACRPFLKAEIAAMNNLKLILALGSIAHNSVLRTLGHKQSAYKFGHAAEHVFPEGLLMIDSYHCSRYNTNTGRLTTEMFHTVFKKIRKILD